MLAARLEGRHRPRLTVRTARETFRGVRRTAREAPRGVGRTAREALAVRGTPRGRLSRCAPHREAHREGAFRGVPRTARGAFRGAARTARGRGSTPPRPPRVHARAHRGHREAGLACARGGLATWWAPATWWADPSYFLQQKTFVVSSDHITSKKASRPTKAHSRRAVHTCLPPLWGLSPSMPGGSCIRNHLSPGRRIG